MMNTMRIFQITLALLLGFSCNSLYASIVANGGFESGTTNWNNLANNGGVATYTVKTDSPPEGSDYLEVDVTAIGGNPWDVQSVQNDLTASLIIGNQYTLTFYAKANSNDNLLQIVLQEGPTWQAVFNRALSTEWQKYTIHFVATANDPAFKMEYKATGVYSIDGITLKEWTGINDPVDVSLNPDNEFQEMEGFGGAITWFIYRLESSADRNLLLDQFVNDVGIDLLRVKNWYYPVNYPTDKSTANMVNWNENVSFQPTIDIVEDVRALNPDIKVLLSSWGPPKALKSNNSHSRGTLSKTGGAFDYGKLADYYDTMLDSIGFEPDWISFQNEPGYEADWRTCKWRPTESDGYPGLDRALDSIYDRIKLRPDLPKILAPEVENVGAIDWSPLGTTYRAFTEPLRSKSYIDFYAFHNYNYNNVSSINNTSFLNVVRDEFTEHPSIMTEYSGKDHSWLDAAALIQNTMVEGGASGYIWWSLIWDEGSQAMVQFDNDLNWHYAKEYHMIKHFAKYVDAGYKRVDLQGNNDTYKGSAYINPTKDEITVVLVNNNTEQEVNFSLQDEWTILSETAYQSTSSNNFNAVATDIENGIVLPDSSITTIVLSVGKDPVNSTAVLEDEFKVFPNPTANLIRFSKEVDYEIISVLGEVVKFGKDSNANLSQLENGSYFVRVNGKNYPIQKVKE